MTKKEIEESVKRNDSRFCNDCGFDLPVGDFFIKKSKNPNHWRFNSPCKSCSNIKSKKNVNKDWHLKKKYGLEYGVYDEMLRNQNNSCAICEIDRSEFKNNLAVDHCHETGKVRALLCYHCNVGLGNFRDKTKLLSRAVKYLNKYTF